MKFPNASVGVKKLFTSEILNIISTICMIIAAIAIVAAGVSVSGSTNGQLTDGQAAGLMGGGIATLIFGFAGVVIAVIAFILTLIGLNKSRKDEPAFNTAFYFVFVGIICSVLSSLLGSTTFIGCLFSGLSSAVNLVVTIYIIFGILSLAAQLNNEAVASKGKTLLYIIVVIYILAIIARLVAMFAPTVAGIIAIVALILEFINYVIFLTYLSQAKKMLAE